MTINTAIKIEPEASVERCEERVAFWSDLERKARAARLAGTPGAYALVMVADHARKAWGAALELAMARRSRSVA
jgi:hypothetical protein